MVMTITRQQVLQEVYSDFASLLEGQSELFSTNSRNRHVVMNVERDAENIVHYHIYNAGEHVALTIDVDAAVTLFNYYGSRDLSVIDNPAT